MTEKISQIIRKIQGDLSSVAPERVGNPDDQRTSHENLSWMISEIRQNGDAWPRDKTGRWLGFIAGVLAEAGVNVALPEDLDDPAPAPIVSAHLALLERYAEMASSAHPDVAEACAAPQRRLSPLSFGTLVGRVQGALCARGATTADAEREFSRPILHDAYRRLEITPPDTTESPAP